MSDVEHRAELALTTLVGESGGREGGGQIKTGSLSVLKELFTQRFVAQGKPHPDGLLVNTDGWHAFQELVPIADPNRWDALRAAVYRELESDGWERINKPRGSQFVIPWKLLGVGESEQQMVILTWNPDKWASDEWWESEVESFPDLDEAWEQWSTGNRSSGVSVGDHAILLRQGRQQGILAIGEFTTECFTGPHWDGGDKDANYAGIEWHAVAHIDERIPTDELIALVPEVPWKSLFASGVQASDEGAEKVLKLCRERFGLVVPVPVSNLPDPDAERARLQGLESWAHYMLSSILAGGRPPGWNKPHTPSAFGEDLVRLIDEQAFGTSRPDRPELYWEFKLNKRPEDAQNGWPDNAFVWSDRLLMIEIKTEPGSVRDGQVSWYLQLGDVNHPGRQVDLLFLTRDPVAAPQDIPAGARYANLTWADLVETVRPLADLMDDADRSVVVEIHRDAARARGVGCSETPSIQNRHRTATARPT